MPEKGDTERRAWYTRKHGKVNINGLIVDYVDASRFEGRIIEHTWNNMGWTPKLVDKPRGNWKAGDAIARMGPKCNVIHISAHGYAHGISRDEDAEEGIRPSDISWLFKTLNRTRRLEKVVLVVNSACNSSSRSWANLFTKKLGVACYVGVRRKLAFDEGIVFPVAFYLKMWNWSDLSKDKVVRAFREALQSVRPEAGWTLWSDGAELVSS